MRITASLSGNNCRIELSEVPELILQEAVRFINSDSTLECAGIEIRLFAMIELMISLENPTIEGLETEMTREELIECITVDMQVDDVYESENTIALSIP